MNDHFHLRFLHGVRVRIHDEAFIAGDKIEPNSVTPNKLLEPRERPPIFSNHDNGEFHVKKRDVHRNAIGVDLRDHGGSDLRLVEVNEVGDEQRVAHA